MTAVPEAPVVILGGGPAGSATALSLKAHWPEQPVVIVEPTANTPWRPGETLSPAARELLVSLGCWRHFENEGFFESPGTLTAWESERLEENPYLFSPRGTGWQLERKKFDALLLERTEASGIAVMRGARYLSSERRRDGLWRLHLRHAGSLDASFVIDATGRAALFATAQGARRAASNPLLAVLQPFRVSGGISRETLIEAQADGWWYSIPTRTGLLAIGWVTDPNSLRRHRLGLAECLRERLERSRYTRLRVSGAQPAGDPIVRNAGCQRLNVVAGDRWLATGDCAAAYDPLSGQGLVHALRFGKLASFAVIDYFRGRPQGLQLYAKLIRQDYDSHLQTGKYYYRQVKRWPHSRFWKRFFLQESWRWTLAPQERAKAIGEAAKSGGPTQGQQDPRPIKSLPPPFKQEGNSQSNFGI
jgi:flavin-dependent dehydrogenase